MARRLPIVSTALGLVLVLAGCAADEVGFADVCTSEDDAEVSTIGYLTMPSAVYCSVHTYEESVQSRCNFDFRDAPDATYGDEAHAFTIYLLEGPGDNSVEVSGDGYYEEDVTIRFDDGSAFEWGDKVRITGTASTEYTCTVDVDKVEPA